MSKPTLKNEIQQKQYHTDKRFCRQKISCELRYPTPQNPKFVWMRWDSSTSKSFSSTKKRQFTTHHKDTIRFGLLQTLYKLQRSATQWAWFRGQLHNDHDSDASNTVTVIQRSATQWPWFRSEQHSHSNRDSEVSNTLTVRPTTQWWWGQQHSDREASNTVKVPPATQWPGFRGRQHSDREASNTVTVRPPWGQQNSPVKNYRRVVDDL